MTDKARSRQGARLLIYSQDGLGLGHLRRTAAIAEEFVRVRPDACVLTVSDSPLGTFFGAAPNQDYLKLPSLVRSGPYVWDPVSLPLPSADVIALRSEIIRAAATRFRPDIVLVDHLPQGAGGELRPTLDALARTPAKLVLGLRDILDAPEVTRASWRAGGVHEAIAEHYDLVLVYGSQDVFDVASAYGWDRATADRIVYCGYVCAPVTGKKRQQVRAECLTPEPNGQLVVAMAGGGADAFPMMNALLSSHDEIRASQPCALTMIAGPFMPAVQRRDLQTRARGGPVRVKTSVKDSASYIAAADLVVGMAGYNTTVEILRLGTPALLVPRAGPSTEQRMRASLFAERGWVRVLQPERLRPATIADAVIESLQDGHDVAEGPDLGGLQVAAGHIASLLEATTPSHLALLEA